MGALPGLTLTSPQVIAVVRELEGENLHPRTLASWARMGVAVPSFWPQRKGRYHVRHYTVQDLVRVRLIVRLRSRGVSMPRVRTILAYLDTDLHDALRPRTRAVLLVDGWRGVIARRPGRADLDVPTGQLRLPLCDVVDGVTETARRHAS